MRVLVLGGTGMLGQELARVLRLRNIAPLTVARSDSDVDWDLVQTETIADLLTRTNPDAVINAAAIVDFAACEADPDRAWRLHTLLLAPLAEWSLAKAKPLIHISTDQYFDGDGDARHDEAEPVQLLNVYAASKYGGEAIAMRSPHALVIRTNFTGMTTMGREDRVPFGRWAMHALEQHQPMILFNDYFCSTIDVTALAHAVCDLLEKGIAGRLNVASSDVASKADFIRAMGRAAGIDPDWAQLASAADMQPRRALSLGLDVSRAETILGRSLPGLEEVTRTLVRHWRET